MLTASYDKKLEAMHNPWTKIIIKKAESPPGQFRYYNFIACVRPPDSHTLNKKTP